MEKIRGTMRLHARASASRGAHCAIDIVRSGGMLRRDAWQLGHNQRFVDAIVPAFIAEQALGIGSRAASPLGVYTPSLIHPELACRIAVGLAGQEGITQQLRHKRLALAPFMLRQKTLSPVPLYTRP